MGASDGGDEERVGGSMAGKSEGMVTLTDINVDSAHVELSAITTPDWEDLIITENSDVEIYEAALNGETVGGVAYSKAGNGVTLLATSVFPAFRGKGIAARLLRGVLDHLRAQGENITVTCPFAAEFVSTHPEYADVPHSAVPGKDQHDPWRSAVRTRHHISNR
jgi:predicted GNAT family acetyltransferase